MTKLHKTTLVKLSKHEFIDKLDQLETGLNSGKMWMNDHCETKTKENRLVRWLKAILSTIFPLKLYDSIKIKHVALSYFEFVKTNREHLDHIVTLSKATRVLTLLDKTTKGKHTKLLSAFKDAIVGNVSREAFAEETTKQKENLLKAGSTFNLLANEFQNQLNALKMSQNNDDSQNEKSEIQLKDSSENHLNSSLGLPQEIQVTAIDSTTPIDPVQKTEPKAPFPIFIFDDENSTKAASEILRRTFPQNVFISATNLDVLTQYNDQPVLAFYLRRYEGRFDGPEYFASEINTILNHPNINLVHLAFTLGEDEQALQSAMNKLHAYIQSNPKYPQAKDAQFYSFKIKARQSPDFEENFIKVINATLNQKNL